MEQEILSGIADIKRALDLPVTKPDPEPSKRSKAKKAKNGKVSDSSQNLFAHKDDVEDGDSQMDGEEEGDEDTIDRMRERESWRA